MKNFFPILFSFVSAYSMAATDPKVAYTMVQEGKAVMVDVREKSEVDAGMVKGALWFPMSRVKPEQDWKKDFREMVQGRNNIFLYCRSGRRSEEFKQILKNENIQAENIGGFETLREILPTTP